MIVNLTLTTSIESRIGTHNHNVANATPPPCCKACRADQSYRRKDLRRRGLRFIGQCDVTKQLLVMRQAIVLVLASYYLDNDQLSLRAATTSHGSPIVDRDVPNAPALSHTTLYRWLTWLAVMTVSLATGCDLFLQAEPSSTVHRFDGLSKLSTGSLLASAKSLRTSSRGRLRFDAVAPSANRLRKRKVERIHVLLGTF